MHRGHPDADRPTTTTIAFIARLFEPLPPSAAAKPPTPPLPSQCKHATCGERGRGCKPPVASKQATSATAVIGGGTFGGVAPGHRGGGEGGARHILLKRIPAPFFCKKAKGKKSKFAGPVPAEAEFLGATPHGTDHRSVSVVMMRIFGIAQSQHRCICAPTPTHYEKSMDWLNVRPGSHPLPLCFSASPANIPTSYLTGNRRTLRGMSTITSTQFLFAPFLTVAPIMPLCSTQMATTFACGLCLAIQ